MSGGASTIGTSVLTSVEACSGSVHKVQILGKEITLARGYLPLISKTSASSSPKSGEGTSRTGPKRATRSPFLSKKKNYQ